MKSFWKIFLAWNNAVNPFPLHFTTLNPGIKWSFHQVVSLAAWNHGNETTKPYMKLFPQLHPGIISGMGPTTEWNHSWNGFCSYIESVDELIHPLYGTSGETVLKTTWNSWWNDFIHWKESLMKKFAYPTVVATNSIWYHSWNGFLHGLKTIKKFSSQSLHRKFVKFCHSFVRKKFIPHCYILPGWKRGSPA